MPLNEFWYGDVRLLEAYKKAYIQNTSYSAWLHGKYSYVAYSIVLSNAFAKKGTPTINYPNWNDPIEILEKKIIKQEHYEIVQHNQEMWFYNMLQS